LPAGRRKLDGVVDEVGDRLDQQVPVTKYALFVLGADPQSNTFVFRYRLVHVAYFAYEIRKCHFAKAGRSLTLLDFRKA
jgi:hypothetical protein